MLDNLKGVILRCCPSFVERAWSRIEASPLGYRLAKGAFWSLFGSVLARGFGLLSTILVARVLTARGFGELGIIQSTVGVFGSAAGFGMAMGATKYVAEFRNSDPDRAGRMIAMASAVTWISSGIFAGALFLGAPWVATKFLAAPHLSAALRIGCLLLLLNGVNGAQMGALCGFEAFRRMTKIGLITGLTSLPLMIGGVWLFGLEGAVWSLVATASLNCLLNWKVLRAEASRNNVRIRYDGFGKEWRILLHFNVPGVLNALMLSFSAWACAALLVNQAGGYSDMGVFNAVKRISQLPEMLLGMFMAPLLPVLSEAYGRKDTQSYNKVVVFAFALSFLAFVPFSLLQLAAPWLTLAPYGDTYAHGQSTVQWVMVAGVVSGMLWPVGTLLISTGRMWMAFGVVVLNTIVFLALGLALVPRYGAPGYAAAAAIALLLGNVPCLIYLHKYFGACLHQSKWRTMTISAVILSAVCAGSACFPKPLSLIVGAACATVFAIGAIMVICGKLSQPAAKLGDCSHLTEAVVKPQ